MSGAYSVSVNISIDSYTSRLDYIFFSVMVLKSRYISLSVYISWAILPLLNRSDSTSLPFIPFVNTSIYQKDSAYFDSRGVRQL
ncbi:hypothetical protein BDZ91DRAFT_463803 [Kalaharituber pfeilii]|nr:hypothetical protein BDZ91DRAFT_463803 [Kalaharituber pfeilii]